MQVLVGLYCAVESREWMPGYRLVGMVWFEGGMRTTFWRRKNKRGWVVRGRCGRLRPEE
jgi:hypothetical protein